MTKKTRNRQTEKAMYMSIISTALCVVMLVGMTFAWFTSTVESSQNVITTASFDVDVLWSDDISTIYATSALALENGWNDLDKTSSITNNNSQPFNELSFLPGQEVVRYIALYNKSTFNVKFDVSLRAITSTGNELLNALEIYELDDVTTAKTTDDMTEKGTAAELQNNDTAALVQIASSVVDYDSTKTESVKVIAVAVKLPESYSVSAPQTVNFFIRVIASQWNVEHGTTSYATVNNSAASFVAYEAPADDQNTAVEITGINAADNTALTLNVQTDGLDTAVSKFTVTGDSSAVAGIDLTLTNADGQPVTFGGTATITTYIAKNLTDVNVKYNGDGADPDPTSVSYDPVTGKLVFTTTHFSEYYVTSASVAYVKSEDKAYDTLPAAVAAAKADDTVILLKDVTGDRISIVKNITLDGNGHTLTDTNTNGRAIWVDDTNVTLNLKNLTIDGANKCQRGVQVNVLDSGDTNFSTVTIDNCTIKNVTHYAINLCSNTTVNLTVNNSSISGYAAINAYGSGNIINVNNSILEGKNPYSGESNAFCTICLEGDTTLATQLHSSDYIITINNTKIIASRTGDQPESVLGFNTNAANSVVNFNNCTFDIGEGCYFAYDISGETTTNSIVIDGEALEYSTNVYFNIN